MCPFWRTRGCLKRTVSIVILAVVAAGTGGCDVLDFFGSNVTFSIWVPLGLSGSGEEVSNQADGTGSAGPAANAGPETNPPAGTLIGPSLTVTM